MITDAPLILHHHIKKSFLPAVAFVSGGKKRSEVKEEKRVVVGAAAALDFKPYKIWLCSRLASESDFKL